MTGKRKYRMDPQCSRYLVVDYIHHRLQKLGHTWTNCPPLLPQPTRIHITLRRMGDEFEERYRTQFEELSEQLQVTNHTAYSTFCTTAEELFLNGGVNWGRIVALFAFSGCLARRFYEQQMSELIMSVVDWTSTYLEHNLGQWIDSHGGWEGFVEFYDKNPRRNNDGPWEIPGVVKIGVLAGIGAMALGAILNRT